MPEMCYTPNYEENPVVRQFSAATRSCIACRNLTNSAMASILIFDDRMQRRRRLCAVLAHDGHAMIEADSAEQALKIIRRASPDLVLVHILAPPPGGCHFARQVRLEFASQRPAVVFLFDNYLENEAALLARACGVAHAAPDDGNTDTLLSVIRTALAANPLRMAEAHNVDADGSLLSPVLSRLYGRLTELEGFSTRLKRRIAANAAKLDLTRGALNREVSKRLWSEEDMTAENNRLREQSLRDPLTGLYNRRYLEETLAREESRARRTGKPFCVMMIDIDHFKRCNDTFGHAAGDRVLCTVSRCMVSMARPEDILCRFGGEEFVLVLTNIEPAALIQRADNLRASIPKLEIVHEEQPIGPITLSIGLAIFPNDGDSAEEVLQVADAAMYQAKKAGRDRVVVGSRTEPTRQSL
jgi:diguanylate cyclase (GGDEF)-like protein